MRAIPVTSLALAAAVSISCAAGLARNSTETNKDIQVGNPAPQFSAKDHDDRVVDNSTIAGKWAVIYFYPHDDTPGCTIEAQEYTKLYEDFLSANALVYGVSAQDKDSHCAFRDKYKLKVPLLVDTEEKLADAFGVKVRMGFASRDTIVITPDGQVGRIDRKVSPESNPAEILKWVRAQSTAK